MPAHVRGITPTHGAIAACVGIMGCMLTGALVDHSDSRHVIVWFDHLHRPAELRGNHHPRPQSTDAVFFGWSGELHESSPVFDGHRVIDP